MQELARAFIDTSFLFANVNYSDAWFGGICV
jgi:hypothetical protein